MATVPTTVIKAAGTMPVYAAASAGGDKFAPGNQVFVHVKNGSAAAVTATFTTPGKVRGLDIADVIISVPASGESMIGPFDQAFFGDPIDKLVHVAWSAVATVTLAVLTV